MIIIPKIQNEKQVYLYNEKGHYITSISVPLSNGRTVVYQFNESSRSITYKRTI